MAVKDLRKLARMQDCMIRIPGYCTHNPEETVLCHVRLAGITGIGRKSPDLIGAWGCAACHAVVDGRIKTDYSGDEVSLMFYEGVFRTQARVLELTDGR